MDNQQFIKSSIKLFRFYKMLGEKAMAQLEREQLFVQANPDTNSIATIVKHLSGNMLSRWTDFLTTDGEKPWRNRDAEFAEFTEQTDVLELWEQGWKCLFNALEDLKPEQLFDIIYIRNEGHTVMEAVNRQLAHYSYHVGQIVFYAKVLKTSDWESLSIPRNSSQSYNSTKFDQEKSIRNFTDEELKRNTSQPG
ncbi:MAG TPA: DUF1572 family protein [Flavobacterium sp.]